MTEDNEFTLADTNEMAEKAKEFGIPIYEDVLGLILPKEWYKKITYAFVTNHLLLPILQEDDAVLVAMADPFDLEAIEELQLILNTKLKPVYTPKDNLLLPIHN